MAFHFPRAIATLLPRSGRAAFASLQLLFQDFVLGREHAMAQLAFGQLNYWQLLFQPWRTIDKNPGGCVFVYDLLLFLWVGLSDNVTEAGLWIYASKLFVLCVVARPLAGMSFVAAKVWPVASVATAVSRSLGLLFPNICSERKFDEKFWNFPSPTPEFRSVPFQLVLFLQKQRFKSMVFNVIILNFS